MKTFIMIAMSLGLLLAPLMVYSQSNQPVAEAPSVAPALVREGDFAIELAGALNLGKSENEAEAEAALVAAGIAPRNGWISDYPVTPDIVADLQTAIRDAGQANRLPLRTDDALSALQNVERSVGIAFVPDTSGTYAEAQPPSAPEYAEPGAVEEYYDEEGPPVYTYYPPPPDYAYLYAWVPSPFWYDAFFFPGFFILNDFDIVIGGHGHFRHGHHDFGHGRISNHIFDSRTRNFARIDPATRTAAPFREGGSRRGFTSSEARRGAAAISGRSFDHRSMGTAPSWTTRSSELGRAQPQTQMPSNRSWADRGTPTERQFTGPQMNGRSASPAPAAPRQFSGGRRSSLGGSFSGSQSYSFAAPRSSGPSIASRSGGSFAGSRSFAAPRMSGSFGGSRASGSFGGSHGGGSFGGSRGGRR